MKQITLTIVSKDYTINLDDDFAQYFERDWHKFMGGQKFLDPKELLNAFVKKSYDSYIDEKAMGKLAQSISEISKV